MGYLFSLNLLLLFVSTNSSLYEKSQIKSGCSINVNTDLGSISPLLIIPQTVKFFSASNTNGTINFVSNQKLLLACPGSSNYITIKGSGVKEVTSSCVSGKKFKVDNKEYEFKNFTCNKWPVHVESPSGKCLSGKSLIKIGFPISTGFVEIMDICHDTGLHNTIYTKFILEPGAAGFQTGLSRPNWLKGNLFVGVNPNVLYTRATERITVSNLLGSSALGEKYIHLTNDYFLAKGHLVARADFLFGNQQMATFWYSNASPQWQTFNGGNWNLLESNVRNFVGRIGKSVEVYTGTWGHCTLPNSNGKETDLYLSVVSSTYKMPVARLFWKVLYDRNTQAGIAFIGLNNPYQDALSAAKDVLCKDICSEISWLTWTQFDLIKGYSYCCEVNDFRKSFPDFPSFPVKSILK